MLSRKVSRTGKGQWKEPGNYNSYLSAVLLYSYNSQALVGRLTRSSEAQYISIRTTR